jgi:Tfp pilus assembly protein PilN
MPQQINLCTPVLLKQKRYFSAQTLLQTLAIFAALGGGLAAYGVWSLQSAKLALQATSAARGPELISLRAAVANHHLVTESSGLGIDRQLQGARAQLKERQNTLVELRRGLMASGQGHSARLQLVAQSIPDQVWITQVRGDALQLQVSGFTEEPMALNDWVAKLAQSPLLQGQQLTRVRVERAELATGAGLARSAQPASAPVVARARPPWAFTLVSVLPPVGPSVPGDKP